MLKRLAREAVSLGSILLAIFSFRSSVAEPYVVPTGSMKPSILPGDYLFVLKTAYDLKLPFTDISVMHFKEPQRGDVVVFKYPVDPSINFVKRLIGLPGDEVVVSDGLISINGQRMTISDADREKIVRLTSGDVADEVYTEKLEKKDHLIQRLPHLFNTNTKKFVVPSDSYFFMGDNRDNSNDSRFWGFVPKSYIKGKALGIWLSLDSTHGWVPMPRWQRIGTSL